MESNQIIIIINQMRITIYRRPRAIITRMSFQLIIDKNIAKKRNFQQEIEMKGH